MNEIKKVAVFGSGVMGASIAAHMANAGVDVLLYDIVKNGEPNRSFLSANAIEKLKKADPAPFTLKDNAKLITPLNIEDDLKKLEDVDWIVEAVLEDIEIKKDLYKKIDRHKRTDAIVSSNTSTIPLEKLVVGSNEEFQKHFIITHFFNPPRYMRLLEIVSTFDNDKEKVKLITDFADKKLGKGIVHCNDTAGFIANRIGCYWLTVGVTEAIDMQISVEDADAVMSRPIGVPKTGVFGLLDLIGIDLMPLIASAFKENLPEDDAFIKDYYEPEIVTNMLKDGYNGRKGKGGFYRLNKDGGKKIKEAKNLQTGEYAVANKSKLQSVDAAKSGLKFLVEHDDIGGRYAKRVLIKTLAYAASLVPEIADSIEDVDKAMKLGYNWKYGPFELIDKLSDEQTSGAKYLISLLEKESIPVPNLLRQVEDDKFYKTKKTNKFYFSTDGDYQELPINQNAWKLSDKKIGKKPLLKNPSAALWEVGDGIVCLEFTSKMNSVDPMVLEMIVKSTELVKQKYKGLIIGNDADNFCVGANIGILLFAANIAAWKDIRNIIKQGQEAYMGLKFAPFPVVSAPSGMALGGGCELLMHSDAVQAHIETYTGLVEVGVGIIPAWGGCKEMLIRHIDKHLNSQKAVAKMGRMFSSVSPFKTLNAMPAVTKSFENIATAKVAKSAAEAQKMLILTDKDSITMNRDRLLADAKEKCLKLAKNYQAPEPRIFNLPGKTARIALEMAIKGFAKTGKATEHDQVVAKILAQVLSGANTKISNDLSEQDLLDLEIKAFMQLVKNEDSMARLEHMLETGKPLRN